MNNILVAPFAGAWIEIINVKHFKPLYVSHPSRVRGLKSFKAEYDEKYNMSHPSRVRGLK